MIFSTGIGKGTSHHSNSVITVAGINCNEMEMYKTNRDFTDSALLPNMTTELNVKLALEDVWMIDGIILLVMKDTAQMKAI